MCELFYSEGLAGNVADCACTTLGLFELKMYFKRKKCAVIGNVPRSDCGLRLENQSDILALRQVDRRT